MSSSPVVSVISPFSTSKMYGVLHISILALIQFSFITDFLILFPLGPDLIKTFNIEPGSFSYLISGYTMSAALSGFFSSFFLDRFDRKRALITCFAFFGIGSLFCILSSSFYMLVFARIFTGAFGGVLSSLVIIYLGDLLPSEKLGRATSMVLMANAFGSILAVPGTLYVTKEFGWQFPFIFLFCLNVLVFVIAALVLPRIHSNVVKNKRESLSVFLTITNTKYIWPIVFMSLLTFAGGSTILPFLSTFVVTNLKFTTDDLSFLFFLGGLSSMVIGSLSGGLIDRYGKQNMFLLFNFFSIIPLILLTIYPLNNKEVALMVISLFFGLSSARHVSGMALINSLFSRDKRGKFISMNNSIQLMAGSFATVIAGSLLYSEEHTLMNFDLLGIIGICATVVCIFTAFIIEE